MGRVKIKSDPPIFVSVQPKPMNINCIRWFSVPMNILEPANEPTFLVVLFAIGTVDLIR
jgi:hypothetical protein